ncbi:MAG: response regulator transcription factor [Lachnospiraceae bacterium]|nr:response regulator transcription factor [Lachnospiraceae bacterium]
MEDTRKQTILIIEDEEAIAELERDYLEQAGFSVEIAYDGDSGLQRALKEEFSLIILDLMLPGTDGFEVCRQVREKKDLPILMVSAKKDDLDKIRGLGFGADDYITKPFSPSELTARVRAHLARYERLVGSAAQLGNAGMHRNRTVEIRGLRIDKDARRVYVNDEEKIMTNKEFDLLTYLAERPNRVFTKDELFRAIWDMEAVGEVATVTVHIKKIREKIEVSTSNPQYIETIWGVGYRFKL